MSVSEDLAMLTSLAGTVGQSSVEIVPKRKKSTGSSSKRSRPDSAEESHDTQPLARRRRKRVDSAVDQVTGEPLAPLFSSSQLILASAPAPSSSAPPTDQDREPALIDVAGPDPSSSVRVETSVDASRTVERPREEAVDAEEIVQALARKPVDDLVSSVLSQLTQVRLLPPFLCIY